MVWKKPGIVLSFSPNVVSSLFSLYTIYALCPSPFSLHHERSTFHLNNRTTVSLCLAGQSATRVHLDQRESPLTRRGQLADVGFCASAGARLPGRPGWLTEHREECPLLGFSGNLAFAASKTVTASHSFLLPWLPACLWHTYSTACLIPNQNRWVRASVSQCQCISCTHFMLHIRNLL